MEFPAHLSSLQDEGRHRGQSMAYNELFLALDEPSEETKTTTTQRPRTFSKARQHICIVHGYILAGTGSNIYSTNVAQTWKKQGHSVTVVCQDRDAHSYPYVDEFYDLRNTEITLPTTPPAAGTLRVVVPDIDNLLPVYVYDEYKGYTVKTIPQLTEEEIEQHITATAHGIELILQQGCDRVLSNHALLSPINTKRACEKYNTPFDIKIHGSGITFVLKPFPQFKKYAIEAILACEKIICGTKYIVDYLNATFPATEYPELIQCLQQKIVIVPPGMDPEVFVPAGLNFQQKLETFKTKVQAFIQKSKSAGRTRTNITLPDVATHTTSAEMHVALTKLGNTYDQRSVDADLMKYIPDLQPNEPIVMYFGKFLNTKGVGEVLLSFAHVLEQQPTARLVLIGFGGFREHIEGMLHSMVHNDVESCIAYGTAGAKDQAPFLDANADQIRAFFRPLTTQQRDRILVTGILQHTQLCEILPLASVVIVGSKAAEAFGMVTVEAMCAGVLPLSNEHSGLSDVLLAVKNVRPDLYEIMKMETKTGGAHGTADGNYLMNILPGKILNALEFCYPNGLNDQTFRIQLGEELREVVKDTFAWDRLVRQLLAPIVLE